MAGDINGDGVVNLDDFSVLAVEFGASDLGPCTVEDSSMLMMLGGGGENESPVLGVVLGLGYTSLEHFFTELAKGSSEQQLAILDFVFSEAAQQ